MNRKTNRTALPPPPPPAAAAALPHAVLEARVWCNRASGTFREPASNQQAAANETKRRPGEKTSERGDKKVPLLDLRRTAARAYSRAPRRKRAIIFYPRERRIDLPMC